MAPSIRAQIAARNATLGATRCEKFTAASAGGILRSGEMGRNRMDRRPLLCLLLAAPLAALAQSWPTQPVRVMVGFPPRGTTDVMRRLTAKQLSDELRTRPVVGS